MRPRTPVVLLWLAVALPSAAPAQEMLRLEVGEEQPLTGFRPLCDDPSTVSITVQGKGTIKGLKAGETVCSWSVSSPLGPRRVVRVVVVAPAAAPGGKKGGGGG